ncbi:MAG TPA: hypothetical protein PK636_04695, partial [bacterium]|nr:hypothetical protein [bacterium]
MKALGAILRAVGCVLAGAAFVGCGSTPDPGPPLDSEYALLARSAARAYAAGNRDYAERLYRRALDRAWLTDNPASVTNAAANLALCLSAQGASGEALKLIDESLIESERLGGPPPALRLIEAAVALKAGEPGRATAALDALEAGAGEPTPEQREETKLLRVRILLESGAPPGPVWEKIEVPGPDSPLRSEYCALAARAAAAGGRWPEAAGFWDERAERQRLER